MDVRGELAEMTGSEEDAEMILRGAQRAALKPAGQVVIGKAVAKLAARETAEVAVKAGAKTAVKVAGKGASKYVPVVGQALMVVDATPVAIEATRRAARSAKTGVSESLAEAKKGRLFKAARRAVGATAGTAKEVAFGVGRTGIAALTTKEIAEATYSKKDREELKEKRAQRKKRTLERKMAQLEASKNPEQHSNPEHVSREQGEQWFQHVKEHLLNTADSTVADIQIQFPVIADDGDTGWIIKTSFRKATRKDPIYHLLHRDSHHRMFVSYVDNQSIRGNALRSEGKMWHKAGRHNRRLEMNPKPGDVGQFQDILACLRALHWAYWTLHWQVSGPNYYADHTLLQRLYAGEEGASLEDAIDAMGERMVAFFGPRSVDPVEINERVTSIIREEQGSNRTTHDLFVMLLNLEMRLIRSLGVAWRSNQDSGTLMSMGVDDLLMGLANEREVAVYLLKRRTAPEFYRE